MIAEYEVNSKNNNINILNHKEEPNISELKLVLMALRWSKSLIFTSSHPKMIIWVETIYIYHKK